MRQPPSQIYARMRHAALTRALESRPGWACSTLERRVGAVGANPGFRWPEAASESQGGYFGGGRFEFLGESADFSVGLEWNPAGRSLLWGFRLHYFDWAPRLAAAAPDELAEQVRSWIASAPPGSQPGWHPYPASLRLVNWIRAGAVLGAIPDEWVPSLGLQAALVEMLLERHLGGNHLIENAFSLTAAGLALRGPAADRWRDQGRRLLAEQIQAQTLSDGGHIERSLSYHFRVNLLCREAIALLKANGEPVPHALRDADARMEAFLRGLLHEDGGVPMFHDAECIEESEWRRYERLKPAA